jgi:protein arginine kinase activator
MLCEECGKAQATVHIERIINGRKMTTNLCRDCAQRSGLMTLGVLFQPSFSINSLMSAFLGSQIEALPSTGPGADGPRCPVCGMSYRDFARAGRLGCSRCYEVFEDRLEPLLRRMHGSDTHVGKAPAGTGERARIRRQLETLKRQLSKVVAEEAYEEAAELRDKIKEFEAKLRGNPA